MKEPSVSGDDLVSLNIWSLIKDERDHGEVPNTLKSIDIIAICQLYDQPIEIYEKIKFIEGVYYKNIVEKHNTSIKEIRSKSKVKNK